MKQLYTLLITFILYSSASSQKETNIWFFGTNAGIDFNSGTATFLSGGQTNTYEGVATVCDTSGSLLFYTDGTTVWAKNHSIMPNGTGLFGASSSSQSAIIVPMPGNTRKYYIFTAQDGAGINGYCYSLVDLTLNGGLGDVVAGTKNIQLLTPVAEKNTATAHSNGTDYWVATHQWNTNSFYVYQVSAAGVGAAVISSVGAVHTPIPNQIGYMKFSHDGKKLAVAITYLSTLEIFDFDNATGIISNPVTISAQEDPYGLEFSPSDRWLYAASRGPYTTEALYQFDMNAGSAAAIIASKAYVWQTANAANYGAIQLAPDGKIYVDNTFSSMLGVINIPDTPAVSCGYVFYSFTLTSGQTQQGLPNFVQSFFSHQNFTYQNLCFGDTTWFTIEHTVDSANWNFGDVGSGPANTSALIHPFHIFSSTGIFTVTLYSFRNGITDTIIQQVAISAAPIVNLGNDTSICAPDTLLLNAASTGATYTWQDGSTSSTIAVTQTGTYSVTVSVSGCSSSDAINITAGSLPNTSIAANQTTICASDSSQICAVAGFSSYLWNTGETAQCITTQLAGNYYVTVSDANGCTANSNHVAIVVYTPQAVSISVNGDTLTAYNATTYQWYLNGNLIPGANLQTYIAIQGGSYTVEVTDTNGCAAFSTAVIVSGIENILEDKVEIYPNPNSSNSWQLAVSKELLGSKVEVYDADGRLVLMSNIEHRITNIEINVSGGIYLMRISGERNVLARKLIKL